MPFRLSKDQKTALRNALSGEELVRGGEKAVIERIEQGLEGYYESRKQVAREKVLRKQFHSMARLGRWLRARMDDSPIGDPALVKHLDAWEQRWRFLMEDSTPSGGRPIDHDLRELARSVVVGLHDADVPLTVGRKSVTVEVLSLVRAWAQRKAPPRTPRSRDYEFSRTVVDDYIWNPGPPPPWARGRPSLWASPAAKAIRLFGKGLNF